MKIIPREKVEEYRLPLPMYKSVKIADAIGKDGAEFDLITGLDEKYVRQLRELSADESDEALQNFTGDKKRFVIGTYEYWYQKNRTIFALIYKQTDELAAIIWFGPKPLGKKSAKFGESPEDARDLSSTWHTVSIRSYPNFRGKGLMKTFAEYALETYRRHFPHVRFWSGMDDRNAAVMKLMLDLGFHVDEANSDLEEHWLIMVKEW